MKKLDYTKKDEPFFQMHALLREFLPTLVTVAFVQISFLKLKFIKSFLELIILQEEIVD